VDAAVSGFVLAMQWLDKQCQSQSGAEFWDTRMPSLCGQEGEHTIFDSLVTVCSRKKLEL
jgi:hypothetical protein